jgi:hypothetical protein
MKPTSIAIHSALEAMVRGAVRWNDYHEHVRTSSANKSIFHSDTLMLNEQI